MNPLWGVFWDYPELTNPEHLRQCLQDAENASLRRWVLHRFLEHGRVVDTFSFFSIEFIALELPKLSLQPYTRKKWKRLVEVYAPSPGK